MDSEASSVPPFDIGTGTLSPDADMMATGRVPLDVYTSSERFEREREVFGRVWLNVAETAEIPDAGDWIVREVKIRSVSAIIVRGKDMKVRAFHNMCSHRGMKLAWADKGRGGKFACPYHAWIYDAQGALLNIPDQDSFPHVDKAKSGLAPIACEVWEGMVFVNLDPQPKQTLIEYLGPVAERIKNIPFGSYPYTARVGCEIEANWKLAIEAQCEAYHVRALHARTISSMLSSKDNPFAHAISIEFLGPHRMQSVPLNPEFELTGSSLVKNFAFLNAAQMTVVESVAQSAPQMRFASHEDINRGRSNVWGNDQYVLYPHFIFHVSRGGWWLHRFWPVAPDRTQWEAVYHFERPETLRSRMAVQFSLAFNRDTLMEDNLALVQQQQVLRGGVREWAQFGDQEILCTHLAAVSESATNDARDRLASSAA